MGREQRRDRPAAAIAPGGRCCRDDSGGLDCRWPRRLASGGLALLAVTAWPATGWAQGSWLEPLVAGADETAASRIVELVVLVSLLSFVPGLLMVVTCFTRFIIVFSFLRVGLGLQSTPSNLILINLALFMTLFVMAPTFDQAWQDGVRPLLERKIGHVEAGERIVRPFKRFMQAHVREDDVRLFQGIAERRAALPIEPQAAVDDLRILVPAFMVSELRRGFEIGFMIVLPFLVIDLVVAIVVMAMGMMMMPPTAFSLPLKVLFFVLVDGWAMLVGSLIRSYG